MFNFFAFETDVGDPVLAAAVRAAGYVEAELLVELGQAFFHLINQPPREALGLCDSELAELCAGAGDGAAPEGRTLDAEADLFQLASEFSCACIGYVEEEQI